MRLSALALCLAGAASAQAPEYTPRAVPEHVYTGGWEHFVGGGVAVFDCDGDGLPELYLAGGSNPAQLMRNVTADGGLAFRAQTPSALALTGVTGAYPIDIDSDGLLDLAILRVGPDMLMQGQGDCAFTPFEGLGFRSGDHWTTAFSATWEAGATLPTLAFGTYVDRADPDGPFEACDASRLYRPKAGRYGPPQLLEPGYCALSILFSDWSRSGRADLRISNDRHYYVRGGAEQMWRMEHPAQLFVAGEGWQTYRLWGMGIASRDVTGDGFPEVYLTSMGDQKLQEFDPAPGGPVWRDVTYARGTTAHRPHVGGDGRPSTGWHAQWGDANNDGRDDIFVAKGNVEQMPDAAMRDPNSLLIQGADGTFAEAAAQAGIATFERSRGAALVDLNRDGALDLVVVNRRAPVELYENTGPVGAWLTVELRAPAPNRRAVGAFIELRLGDMLHTREITLGGGHASGQAVPEHFGLGQATSAQLRVIWPDGRVGAWQQVEAGHHLVVTRDPAR
ncbi:CRTAC1 family protein [Aliishimia ponticola]|uniref:CRTAC1 family protein n=1 Tax=Aliishimia ponticola TaxID=2499833 RepID=A0A4S4NQV4_9RHOB|nr:CRTAC1 family protein [Aliishimia ponticola]THH38590.1 CRTAC1 family protein [Aliishimia ponticola]